MPLREIFKATEPSDVEAAQRRLALSQALHQRALTPNTPAAGGPVQAKYGVGNALVDLATALTSAWGVKKAEAAYGRAKTAKETAAAEALKNMIGGQNYDQTILQSQDAITKGANPALVSALLSQRAPKQAEGYTLGPGEKRFEGGNEIASVDPLAPKADSFTLSPGEQRYQGDKMVAQGPPKIDKPESKFRTLSPAEVASAGLPAGTSAQVNDTTGQINILSKRDNTPSLSQKDQTAAKTKLNSVQIARQQLAKIKQTFAEGREGMNAFGPGQGMLPTQAGKKFDAAIDQMRSTITALTRTPGVGAMSDYETKLDQSKFPSRSDYEVVTEQKIQGLDDLLNAIESGYSGLLVGAQNPQQDAAPAQSQSPVAQEVTATGPNGQKIVLRNGQWVPLGN